MRRPIPRLLIFAGAFLLATPVAARQDHVLCTQTPAGPWTVTSGAPFVVTWIMPDTALENGITVPNRVDGFYVQVDAGPKTDIGLASALTPCSASSARPGDIPYTYKTTQGVSRGTHQLKISAWNFALDGSGNPTTNRQESTVTTVPFSAGDPVLSGPPLAPASVVITSGSGPATDLLQRKK